MQWNDTAHARFLQKIKVVGTCWVWTGAHSRDYPTMSVKPYKRTIYAHRFAYEFYNGRVPEGWEVDHLCGVRDCVNPDHLEAVERRTNIYRYRSSNFTAQQARRTHCPRGHPYDEVNTRWSNGHRSCRACAQEKVAVMCSDCGATWLRVKQGLGSWSGRCNGCAQRARRAREKTGVK